MEHPEIFCPRLKDKRPEESYRLPPNAQVKISYADTICWKHDAFRIIQQRYDAKHSYMNHIGFRCNGPVKIKAACRRGDLYWFFQLQGQSEFMPEGRQDNTFPLPEGTFRMLYVPCGTYELKVDSGEHRLFFFLIQADWLLRNEPSSRSSAERPFLRALKHQHENVLASQAFEIDDLIKAKLLQLFELSPEAGFMQDTEILSPIGQIVDQSFKSLKAKARSPRYPNKTIHAIRAYVQENVPKGRLPEIPRIAAHFALSPSYLRKLHRGLHDQSLQTFIIETRLKEAMRLLTIEGRKPSEVAYSLGYGEHSSFTRQFKERFGITPSEARKRCRKL